MLLPDLLRAIFSFSYMVVFINLGFRRGYFGILIYIKRKVADVCGVA
jgi:hypothetical protein